MKFKSKVELMEDESIDFDGDFFKYKTHKLSYRLCDVRCEHILSYPVYVKVRYYSPNGMGMSESNIHKYFLVEDEHAHKDKDIRTIKE